MKRLINIFCVLSIFMFALLFLNGCGSDKVDVRILDMMTETVLSAKSGITVGQAIKEAEIYIGEKDEVSPSEDTVISDNTEIKILRYAAVTVKYNKDVKTVELKGAKVSKAIKEAGIKLSKNESVNYDTDAYLFDGMEIVVTKLINVNLTVDGKTEKIKTEACTVKQFLEKQGIKLSKEDIVTPSLKTKMNSDTALTVKRVKTEIVTVTKDIAYETVYKTSNDMKAGTSKVTQQGVNGQKKVKCKITYIDNVESETEILEETIIKSPVNKIITQGAQATKPQTSQGGKTIVSKQRVDDCDGSGHGYFVITWSDGSVTYEEY